MQGSDTNNGALVLDYFWEMEISLTLNILEQGLQDMQPEAQIFIPGSPCLLAELTATQHLRYLSLCHQL